MDNFLLDLGDKLLVEGEGAPLEQARRIIGEATAAGTIVDVRDLDDLNAYVSRHAVIGQRLADLNIPEQLGCNAVSVIRGDSELYPHPTLVLEAGDRMRLVAEPGRFKDIQEFFSNSTSSFAEVSYLSLGLGMVLGVLFGSIPFPLPGIGSLAFGAAGATLIVSLVLGWQEHTAHLSWTIPPSANLTLRNFGLTIFLAVVCLRSADNFITRVQSSGFVLRGFGLITTTYNNNRLTCVSS